MPDVDGANWATMSVRLLFVMAALGVVLLLVREKTRATGIKIVAVLALAAVLSGVFVFRGVQQWEYNREWDWRDGHSALPKSQQTQSHDSADHSAGQKTTSDYVAPAIATPAPIVLPENSVREVPAAATTSATPPVVGEGRPPEPQPENIVERELEGVQIGTAPPVAPPVAATTPASDRPAWVDLPPRRAGDVYIAVASSGPFVTDEECSAALYEEAQKVARRVIDDLIGPGTADVVQGDAEYSRRLIDSVSKQQYSETRSTSVGPMKIMYVRLEFGDDVRADLKQRWRQMELELRLRRVSRGAVWVLVLVGTVYSFLKVDTATRGYYTKRLQVAAVVVILAIIALAA